jgi:methylenetetrahydrofolate reductase (NADPH)
MKLTEIHSKKKNVLSFEIFPPKKEEELHHIDETLEVLSSLNPDFISVTFGAGGSSNNNKTIELAKKIKYQYHIEPVVHLTCLCYSRHEIDSFLAALRNEGIENILALRGDKNPDIPAKDDFKHASELTAYINIKGDFCIAGACYPEVHPESASRVTDILHMKEKEAAGAQVFLSQLFFDNDNFYHFIEDCKLASIKSPITPGIMPVVNAAQIKRMTTMCGASLPKQYISIIEKYGDNKEAMFSAGISYAVSQIIDLLAHNVDGIHLYTMNNPKVAMKICEGIREFL